LYKCTICEQEFDQIPVEAQEIQLRYGKLYRFATDGVSTVHSLREVHKKEEHQNVTEVTQIGLGKIRNIFAKRINI
jgi:hypothetical protein